MLHGTRDAIVPIALGRRLFASVNESARASFVEVPGAGHEDVFEHETARGALRELWAHLKGHDRTGDSLGARATANALAVSWVEAAGRGIEQWGAGAALLGP